MAAGRRAPGDRGSGGPAEGSEAESVGGVEEPVRPPEGGVDRDRPPGHRLPQLALELGDATGKFGRSLRGGDVGVRPTARWIPDVVLGHPRNEGEHDTGMGKRRQVPRLDACEAAAASLALTKAPLREGLTTD